MAKIESVTVLPDGVAVIHIAGFDIPIILRPGETIRYINVSVEESQIQHHDGKKTTILMRWMELPG